MSISMSEAPMELIKQMKKQEVKFRNGEISAEYLIIFADAFERNCHKQYWGDNETIEALIKLNFSDDFENGSRISQYVKRTKEELKEIKTFNVAEDIISPIIPFRESWRDFYTRVEVSDNKDKYKGKTINWIAPYTLEEEGEYTFMGIGEKSIMCLDKNGEKHFFWFQIPKYVVLGSKYKNAHGHGHSIARQLIAKYGDNDIKKKIGL